MAETNTLNKEFQIASKLLNGGFNSATRSMGRILNTNISMEIIEQVEIQGDDFHIVKSVLQGELKGSCYLVLSEEDVEKISFAGLPRSVVTDNSEYGKAMRTGLLTEIDNLIAAAVITELADTRGVLLYGDVPSITEVPHSEVRNYLKEESGVYDTVIHFKAQFMSEELNIKPIFVWMFQSQLMDKIKEILKS